MKKIIRVCICFFILLLLNLSVCNNAFAFSGSGSGTVNDPYLITNAQQLAEIKNNLTAYYKIANDIDLDNVEFNPIGSSVAPFKGVLDGGGYTISDLKISKPYNEHVGLFGYTASGSIIKDVTIKNVEITAKQYIGALVGYSSSTIINCSVIGTGKVSGTTYIGGLVGYNTSSIRNSYTDIELLSSGTYIGGLVGINFRGNIEKCYTTGNTDAGKKSNVGGLVGYNAGKILESYTTGDVSGGTSIGGLVGYSNSGTIENSFSLSSPTGTSYVGGLIGKTDNTVMTNCYFAGKLNSAVGSPFSGGGSSISVSSSYYDSIQSGIVVRKNNYSRLTSKMKDSDTYLNWDFSNIWNIEEGVSYPYLKNLAKPSGIESNSVNENAGGEGTETNPYLIDSAHQLKFIIYEPDANYKLINDVDLDNVEFTPIGTSYVPFEGRFDGGGYTISNLKISNDTTDIAGLFGYTRYGSIIKNVTIKNVDITGTRAGSLVAVSSSLIENCSVIGKVKVFGYERIGGLVGDNRDAIIRNSSVGGRIKNSNTDIEVLSTGNYVGGLVGRSSGSSATIENCSVAGIGKVSGRMLIGGLVGENSSSIKNSNTDIEVLSTGNYVGGLVGRNEGGVIEKCYATGNTGDVKNFSVGGLVGEISASGKISESYATGNVIGYQNVGGLVGTSGGGSIYNSFSLSNVTGEFGSIRGLVGSSINSRELSVVNCYFAGKINRIPAELTYSSNLKINSSYFDSTITNTLTPTTQARTTEQMMQKATFVNWDTANIWVINDGLHYPYLKNLDNPFSPPLLATTLTYKELTSNSIVLEWDFIADATEYEILHAGEILTTSNQQMKIEHLSSNTSYEFKVRGKNAENTSSWSPILNIRTESKPLSNVQGLTCIGKTGNSVTLSWDELSEVTGYEVVFEGQTMSTNLTTLTIKNLSSDNTYSFQVRGVNGTIKGQLSDVLIVKTYSFNPQTPYAIEFYEKCEEQWWLIDELELILNKQGKSLNTIQSKNDFANVVTIGLMNRKISGKIPTAIGELYNLEYLYLSKNQLSGVLPSELYSLTKLKNLDLSSNNFKGSISEQISLLTELKVLLLHKNDFDGKIPDTLGTLTKLENLDLAQNSFTGNIPSGISNLKNLKFLSLSDNELTGTVPSLVKLTNLEVLILSDNQFTGEVINTFSDPSKIRLLDFSNNEFSGDVDDTLLKNVIDGQINGVILLIK